jgi:hypothetical protein
MVDGRWSGSSFILEAALAVAVGIAVHELLFQGKSSSWS